jgi:CheY-like chemotaxis protein
MGLREDLHFLFVEDDDDLVLLFRRALARTRSKGVLHIVQDGEEAVAYLSGRGKYADRDVHPLPCLIITDLHMPRRNGIELLDWIRGQEGLREIPVVLLSTSNDPRSMKQAESYGAKAYWVKPAELRELEKVARRVAVFLKLFCAQVKRAVRSAGRA